MKKYNLSNIMKKAWELFRKGFGVFANCLRESWKIAKEVKIMLDTCFIGIDVSSKSNVVHVMDKNGEKLWADSFLNSLEGTNQLLNRVCNEENFKDTFFVFGLEATGIYGKGLFLI